MKRMILILSLSVVLLAAVGLLACGGNGSSTGQPRIYFDEDFVDVGIVPPGVSLDYTFHFTNEGDAPLIITDTTIQVVEGCCPGQPVVGPTTLQPGDEGTVRVKTPTVQEMNMAGLHVFKITVKSNDPVEPNKILHLVSFFEPAE